MPGKRKLSEKGYVKTANSYMLKHATSGIFEQKKKDTMQLRMTIFLLVLIFVTAFKPHQINIEKPQDPAGKISTNDCLRVKCNTFFQKKKLHNFKITVYENDTVLVKTYQINEPKKLVFHFERNKHFLLVYYKEGYYPRKVRIDTSLPDAISLKEIFSFTLEMQMTVVQNFLSEKYDPERDDALIRFVSKTNAFKLFKGK